MKKIILGLSMVMGVMIAHAQSEKFTVAMKKNLAAVDTSFNDPQSMLALSNNFERIAIAEKNQWLPYYYAALMQVNYGFMQKDMSSLDPLIDRAEALLAKADSLMPNNSEISCIKSMIATERMLVDPQQRYMQYRQIIASSIEAAKAQDPSNPRPYYLTGENLKNTPAQFGGGCDKARPQLLTAKEKFATFKPAGALFPDWGANRNEAVLADCK